MSNQVLPQSIIVIPAHPAEMALVDLESEVRLIQQGLAESQCRDRLSVRTQWINHWSDLQSLAQSSPPSILHVYCPPRLEPTLAATWIESAQDLPDAWPNQIACIVFKTGYDSHQARAIAQQIPFVIAIPNAIESLAADQFIRTFYQTLSEGNPLKLAYHAACRAILTSDFPKHWIPSLIQRPTRIYLSFLDQSPDGAIAQHIAAALKTYGYAPTIAAKSLMLEPSQQFGSQHKLDSSYDYVLLLLSPHSIAQTEMLTEMVSLTQWSDRQPLFVMPICINLPAAESLPQTVRCLLQRYAPRDWADPRDTADIIRELLYRLTDDA
jgi:hypothetical protein